MVSENADPNIRAVVKKTVQSIFTQTSKFQIIHLVGSGWGSVGRADASATRGLRFETSHRANFILNNICCQL